MKFDLNEFLIRLTEKLDFKQRDEDDQWSWLCGNANADDRFWYTREVAKELNLDVDALITMFKDIGHCCCDCEIVFNYSSE